MTTETTPKPLRAGMTAAAIQAERAALQSRLDYINRAQVRCAHCAHFEPGEFCAVAQQQVPADFQRQVDACTDWVWDEIPF